MTSKSVLVKTPNQRNFKVTFVANGEQSDFAAFKNIFYKICERDYEFSKIISNGDFQRFLFRKYDEAFKCDIELTDFEEIPHGTVIDLFISTSVMLDLPLHPVQDVSPLALDSFPSIESSSLQNVATVKVEADECTNMEKEESTFRRTDNDSNNIDKDELEFLQRYERLKNFNPRKESTRRGKLSGLTYPCALPEFSPDMKRSIMEGNVRKNYCKFIRECAAFFLTLVEKPSKEDYDVFCQSLFRKYDFINEKIPGTNPYRRFKKALSQTIRNSRHYSKHKRNFKE